MLTVYKASAGSGKTFRLAVEYIKQLIIDPYSYEHTLAVTFTNKATEEMKMRIMSQLFGLANQLESSKAYMDVIISDLIHRNENEAFTSKRIDESFVADRSRMALRRLLHNYSFFRVQTIDKFFQSVLRNLARELDLTPNLRVELSAKEIEEKAVDTWIDGLHETDKELNWIMDFVHASMDDNKSWNIISKIKTFGGQLLSDDYKEFSEQLEQCLNGNDPNFFKNYNARLRGLITSADKHINEAGKEICAIIEQNGLDEKAFTQGGRGVGGFMRKMCTESIVSLAPNAYVLKALDPDDTNADNWTSKKAKQAVKDLCRTTLRPLLIKAMADFEGRKRDALSAKTTLRHLSELRMLQAIREEIKRSNADHDRFLLSDTQSLLYRMIDGSDSPFIFEKIGSRLQSIMIDEFQDTSRIQWQNFKVLLNDCMAHGHDNLIVGDVKQSIYRWRSGDWRLLNNIDTEFAQPIDIQTLDVNRRSSTRVIEFNNAFFRQSAEVVRQEAADTCAEHGEMIEKAYRDVAQKYPDGKTPSGYVEVQLLPKEDYDANTMDYVVDTIAKLVRKGVKQNDIAVLVRGNKEISAIAQYCVQSFAQATDEQLRSIRIVSDEGFLLKSSPAVCILVDAIRLLLSPDNQTVRSRLSLNYQRYLLGDARPQHELLSDILLPDAYVSEFQTLVSLPLYQLCEHLYTVFGLNRLSQQSAYVCYFFDCLTEYINNSIADIPGFISHWDEHICNKSIESDSDNGIRILTIHKSKGLEYGHVIVPYCSWKHNVGTTTLWCQPDRQPFDDLPAIPLDYGKALQGTIYEPYYHEEHMQILVDNINLLYVAFTRAKDGLYISTQSGQSKDFRGHLLEKVLADTAESLPGAVFDEQGLTFGEITVEEAKTTDRTETNIFLQPSVPMTVNIVTNDKQPEFRESNKSKEFTLTDEDADEQQQAQYIQLGNILHSLFASIRTVADIPSALFQLEMDGMLYGQDITAEMLRQHIDRCFENKQIADWFSDRWTLYNECTILTYDADTDECIETRPDRVMTDGDETIVVDFKLYSFKDKYRDQVRGYMDRLRSMGHKNVRGYLWLVFSNKIIEVK